MESILWREEEFACKKFAKEKSLQDGMFKFFFQKIKPEFKLLNSMCN